MSQVTNGIRSVLSSPAVYDFFQNIMGARKVRRELVEDFIRPEPGAWMLDVGCGTADILRYLPNTVGYWGYDISPEYIAAAKAEYGARGNFRCGFLGESDLDHLPKFDLVIALGVLHHLSDNEAQAFFALAYNSLNKNGRVVTIDPCFADGQNAFARYIIERDRGQNVRDPSHYLSIANKSFIKTEGTLRHRAWVPYTHWIMECEK